MVDNRWQVSARSTRLLSGRESCGKLILRSNKCRCGRPADVRSLWPMGRCRGEQVDDAACKELNWLSAWFAPVPFRTRVSRRQWGQWGQGQWGHRVNGVRSRLVANMVLECCHPVSCLVPSASSFPTRCITLRRAVIGDRREVIFNDDDDRQAFLKWRDSQGGLKHHRPEILVPAATVEVNRYPRAAHESWWYALPPDVFPWYEVCGACRQSPFRVLRVCRCRTRQNQRYRYIRRTFPDSLP